MDNTGHNSGALTEVQLLRIRRRAAHAAAAAVNKIPRSPAMDRIHSIATREARKANLVYAYKRGIPLSIVETVPTSKKKSATRVQHYNAEVTRLIMEATKTPYESAFGVLDYVDGVTH